MNTGRVTKAAHPNYTGTTPGMLPIQQTKTRYSEKNEIANELSRKLLDQGVYRIDRKDRRIGNSSRRIHPTEFRGKNYSDCMYHTSTSFNNARKYQSPLVKDSARGAKSPDYKYPIGGGQVN